MYLNKEVKVAKYLLLVFFFFLVRVYRSIDTVKRN